MAQQTIFVTGATGLVGAAMTELLLHRGHTVFALARGENQASAEGRVHRALTSIAPNGAWRSSEGLVVLRGDVTLDKLGLEPASRERLRGQLDFVVHTAGITRFDDPDTILVNLNGTERLVGLFGGLGWGHTRLIHVSTAYVCGRQVGQIIEERVDHRPRGVFHNVYEHSKALTEAMLFDRMGAQVTIVRPSIVVGALGPAWEGSIPVTLEGYYAYFRAWSRLKQGLQKIWGVPPGEVLDVRGTRVAGDPMAIVDLVPADNLAEMILALAADSRSEGCIYHATNRGSQRYESLVEMSLRFLDIIGARIVLTEDLNGVELTPVEAGIRAGIDPFMGYVGECREFDTRRMGEIYDMNRIPAIGEEEVRRLLEPAVQCQFKAADRR